MAADPDIVNRLRPRFEGMPTRPLQSEHEDCPHCGHDNIDDHEGDEIPNPATCHRCGKEYLLDVDANGGFILRALRSPADVQYINSLAAAGIEAAAVVDGLTSPNRSTPGGEE